MIVIPIFLPEHSCPNRCGFCSLEAANGPNAPVDSPDRAYRIVKQQLDNPSFPDGAYVEVAFYGGTFTRGGPEAMAPWLAPLQAERKAGRISGIRVSTRPDSIDEETLSFLKDHGVRTIELGVQSLDDGVLRHMGRGHTARQAKDAVRLCREAGLVTGVHLMTGLPVESATSWRNTVRATIDMRPDTVRIHPLLVLAGTRFDRDGVMPLPDETVLERVADALLTFHGANIPVIRVGLQATDQLTAPGTIKAGLHHPALRHRAMSRLYGRLLSRIRPGPGVQAVVHPSHLSYAIGFKRENARRWVGVSFQPDDSRQPWGLGIGTTWYDMKPED